jgi:hypothetical protein
MIADEYRKAALALIDDYLAGKASRETVWKWAQEIIMAEEWDTLPADLADAIHGLWLLHDEKGSWVPDMLEIRHIRDELTE